MKHGGDSDQNELENHQSNEGFCLTSFLFFSLWAVWLLGFWASWLFGFLASRLLGFSAFCCFWWLFGFGFSLCIPSSSSAGGFLAFACMRLLAAMAFRMLCFHSSSLGFLVFASFHWFLDLASCIISITSSSL